MARLHQSAATTLYRTLTTHTDHKEADISESHEFRGGESYMTKKDYVLIANGLRMLVDSAKVTGDVSQIQYQFIANQTVNYFVRKLQEQNTHFDKDKFLEAVNR